MIWSLIAVAIMLWICCGIFYSVSENDNNEIETSIANDEKEYDKDLAIKIYNKCLVKDVMNLESKKSGKAKASVKRILPKHYAYPDKLSVR